MVEDASSAMPGIGLKSVPGETITVPLYKDWVYEYRSRRISGVLNSGTSMLLLKKTLVLLSYRARGEIRDPVSAFSLPSGRKVAALVI